MCLAAASGIPEIWHQQEDTWGKGCIGSAHAAVEVTVFQPVYNLSRLPAPHCPMVRLVFTF